MKCTRLALAVAVAVGLATVPAFAWAQSGLVQPVDYETKEYYAADDGAKAPVAPPAAAPAAPADASCEAAVASGCAASPACGNGSCGCDCGCGCGCGCGLAGLLFDDCKLDCPDLKTVKLFDDCCWLKCHNITVGGWIETGFSGHDGPRNPDGYNGPDGFNDRDQEFNGDQFYTTVQKALKDNDTCWDWGFTVDTLVGEDYDYPLARGLDAKDNGAPRWYFDNRKFYGLAIPQAYLEVGWSDLSAKVGHMYTLLGNEVVNPTANFFYSHNYAFLYAYPFTQTGVVVTQKWNDQVVINYGFNEGWDNWDDTDENVSATGGFTWTSCDKKQTLAYFFQVGNEPSTPFSVFGPFHNRFVNSAVYTDKLSDRLTYTQEAMFAEQSDGNYGGTSDASWYGSTAYLTYQLNCCWTEGLRFEYFRDTEGTRVAGNPTEGGNASSAGGFAGDFYDVTYGLNYKMNGNVTIRPEIRYDWFQGQDLAGVKPYMNGASNHQWIYSVDAIVLF